jgi:hypothetical protein
VREQEVAVPIQNPRRGRIVSVALVLILAIVTGLAARPITRFRLDVGRLTGGVLTGPWSDPDRTDRNPEAGALDPEHSGSPGSFFRAARPGSGFNLPVAPRGKGLRVGLWATARVRTAVTVFVDGRPAGDVLVRKGPWSLYTLDIPEGLLPQGESEHGLDLTLNLRPLPLVRVPEEYVANPELLVQYVEVDATQGLALSAASCALLAAVPVLLFAFGRLVGFSAAGAVALSAAAAPGTILLARLAPFPLLLAVPRLLAVALLAGLLTAMALARCLTVARRERAILAAMVAGGTIVHGSLAFFADREPVDTEIHLRRARDLAGVPLEYDALLRYGSHLPTASQTFGKATAALGERTLIPYSPLPYIVYDALSWAGIDLRWGIMALNTILAMAVAPGLWIVARRLWGRGGAWIATTLYVLDLPVWHHLSRAHAPAAFGGALATAALLLLVHSADRLSAPRRVALTGLALALAALGYSSLAVLLGLFGLVLLLLLETDARGLTPAARRGVASALLIGGFTAGLLFYVHYVPGLLQGARGLEAEPDLFLGRTYLLFHNESRQSMRIWAAGFALPLVAGLLSAPLALRRAPPFARPLLASWLAAWALVMVLKEPGFFPRPLRWAKEEQFVSPLLDLMIGGAIAALPLAWMRWAAAATVVAMAAWLQCGDFLTHLRGLMP